MDKNIDVLLVKAIFEKKKKQLASSSKTINTTEQVTEALRFIVDCFHIKMYKYLYCFFSYYFLDMNYTEI